LEKYVAVTDLKDIEKLEKTIENIEVKIPSNFKIPEPKKREDIKLDLNYLVNLSDLNEKEIQAVKKVIEEFKKSHQLMNKLKSEALAKALEALGERAKNKKNTKKRNY
ncbi:unnamed protein product, partial [marine sediment metagenome]